MGRGSRSLRAVSWTEAKTEAHAWAERAGFHADVRGKMLLVPVFAEDSEADFFIPGRNAAFHRMMVQAIQRTGRKAGAKVVPVFLYPKDYRAWLRAENLEDTAERRTQYFEAQTKVV